MTSCSGLALTTSMRMVDRVHCDTADLRPSAKVAGSTGLSERHVHVVLVAELSDGGAALSEDESHLTGRQTKSHIVAFLGHDGRSDTGRADELTTTTERKLDVVHRDAKRDVLQRQGVSNRKRSIGTRKDLRSYSQPLGAMM